MNIESKTSLSTYLMEINKVPLLTAIEEIELGRKIAKGGKIGELAREKFIKSNLRFVVKLSRYYRNQGLSQMDLIQEGNIGLIDAVDRFNPELGYRFSTFSAYWIRQAMQRAISKKARTIRLPVRKHRAIARMEYIKGKYYQQHGKYPDEKELSNILNLRVAVVKQLINSKDAILSLESPMGDADRELIDLISDVEIDSPRNTAIFQEMKNKIKKVIGFLSEREQKILQWRFGFDNGKNISLRNISRHVGLSQEGVRRIEKQAINKLRRSGIQSQLQGLL